MFSKNVTFVKAESLNMKFSGFEMPNLAVWACELSCDRCGHGVCAAEQLLMVTR